MLSAGDLSDRPGERPTDGRSETASPRPCTSTGSRCDRREARGSADRSASGSGSDGFGLPDRRDPSSSLEPGCCLKSFEDLGGLGKEWFGLARLPPVDEPCRVFEQRDREPERDAELAEL